MNASQLKYAKERLRTIYQEKNRKFYSTGFSREEKLRLYAQGEAVIDHDGHGNFFVVFTGEAEQKQKAREEAELLRQRYEETLDELMLGSEETALQLIKTFAEE